MPLQMAKAQNWMATNGADFLRRKKQRGKTSACNVKLKLRDGRSVQISDEQRFRYVVLNARAAPAADVAMLLELDRRPGFLAECIQCKQGGAKVNAAILDEESAKSCDKQDFLLVLCTGDKNIDLEDMPSMTGIVQESQWQEYFGPFVGRAFPYKNMAASRPNQADDQTKIVRPRIGRTGVRGCQLLFFK